MCDWLTAQWSTGTTARTFWPWRRGSGDASWWTTRARSARKRGGGDARVTFDEALVVTAEARENFVALDDALEALAKLFA